MIIWLASYPRSGNTFFRIIMNFNYNIKTYSIYNDPLLDQVNGMCEIVGHEQLPAPIEELKYSKKLYFIKTHNLPTDNLPAIYLVRDGRDSLVSFSRYIKAFVKTNKSLWKRAKERIGINDYSTILKDLIVSERHYGGWSGHVKQWRQREGTTFTVKYEDLIKDPLGWTQKAFEAVGHKPTLKAGENHPSFEELNAKWPEFFRKGKKGTWKEEMPPELHELFWKYHGDTMKELAYEK